jgi:hypothetical protein
MSADRKVRIQDVGDVEKLSHAPIAGDNYAPTSTQPELVRGPDGSFHPPAASAARRADPEAFEKERQRVEQYDKGLDAGMQPTDWLIPGSGPLSGFGKWVYRAVKSVTSKAVKRLDQAATTKKENDRQATENSRKLRDAMDKHHIEMRDKDARSREQNAVERGESRERRGDKETKIA